MSGWQAAVLVIAGLVLLAGPALWWVFNSGYAPDPEAAARFRARQVEPDFEAFRRHFGCEAPAPLRELFSDPAVFTEDRDMFDVLLKTDGSVERWFIAWIEPIDEEHLSEPVWPGTEGFYAFANNGAGDQYLIDPRDSDPEILYYEHETGRRRPVGATLSTFLSAERLYDSDE